MKSSLPASVAQYPIALETFEGPLDLLMHLIQKNEIDIQDIPIATLTHQYIAHLEQMKTLHLDIAGEFVVMASTLMLIKSRMLLPKAEDEDGSEALSEEDRDPRRSLVYDLLEYRRIKAAAQELEAMETGQLDFLKRDPAIESELGEVPDLPLEQVDIMALLSGLNEVMSRLQQTVLHASFEETVTVAQQIDWLRRTFEQNKEQSLDKLFKGLTSRAEVVCSFLALLELVRQCWLRVFQDRVCGDIILKRPECAV